MKTPAEFIMVRAVPRNSRDGVEAVCLSRTFDGVRPASKCLILEALGQESDDAHG